MIWLYIATAVLGGAFVIPLALGGLDFDADVGDVGHVGDFDMGADHGIGGAIGDFVGSLLNFRSAVLALTFFGLSGIVFTVADTNAALTLVTALALGFAAALANSTLTRYVTRSQQSSQVTLRDIRGMSAEVVLPIADERRGRVRAQIAGQTEYFTALPHKAGQSFAMGETVVVVEIEDGMAKVASLRELT